MEFEIEYDSTPASLSSEWYIYYKVRMSSGHEPRTVPADVSTAVRIGVLHRIPGKRLNVVSPTKEQARHARRRWWRPRFPWQTLLRRTMKSCVS